MHLTTASCRIVLSLFVIVSASEPASAQTLKELEALTPPKPHPVTPITVPTHFCSQKDKDAALEAAGVEWKKYFANGLMATAYEHDVRRIWSSYPTAGQADAHRILSRKAEEAKANSEAHDAAGELNHEAFKKLERVPVADCSKGPPDLSKLGGGSGQTRPRFTIFTGVDFGGSGFGPFQPLPLGPEFPAPNGRRAVGVPSWLFEGGANVVNGVLDALNHEARVTSLEAVERSKYWDSGWGVGGRAHVPIGESRFDFVAGLLYRQGITDPDTIRRVAEGIGDDAEGAFLEMLSPAPDERATFTIDSTGGYSGAITFSGGLERTIARMAGFDVTVGGGALYTVMLGDPDVMNIRFDYGFTGGGIPFQESDQVDLTIRSSQGFGVEAGLGFRRPLNNRLDLTIGLDLAGERSTLEVLASTHPVSTAGAQLGAAAFATPPGVTTMVFSTIPTVPTSLSLPVTNHVLSTRSSFDWRPRITAGIRF